MKNLIIGIVLGLSATAYASYFAFSSQKTTIAGRECIVVRIGAAGSGGVGVSCNWGR